MRSKLCALAAVLLGAVPARAQVWTVTNLHPAAVAFGSSPSRISGGQQVGFVSFGNPSIGEVRDHASLWSGTAESWIDLHPDGWTNSIATGVFGGQQVGYAFTPEEAYHAGLWTGTTESWVDLHPAAAVDSGQSYAYGVYAGQQVGQVLVSIPLVGSFPHASLWNGSAASWVDLHPAGAPRYSTSSANGVYAGQQVGQVDSHASLWSGTAASWVDLHPARAINSTAVAVHAGQQVGTAFIAGQQNHAALWSGTAASFVDLNPAGSFESRALGVFAGQQVGFASVGGAGRASLWSGTAASWQDLSSFLSGSWGFTAAEDIWGDGTTTYVVGWGHNLETNRSEALLWTRSVPEPSSLVLLSGIGVALFIRRVVSGRRWKVNAESDYDRRVGT